MNKHKVQKHQEENQPPKYECNFCEFSAEIINDIWNHKLEKHTGQSLNFNNLDKDVEKNDILKFLAEQNTDIIEEVINLKTNMKAVIGSVIDDFEEGMKVLRDDSKKHFNETTKALAKIHRKIKNPKVLKDSTPTTEKPSSSSPIGSATPNLS